MVLVHYKLLSFRAILKMSFEIACFIGSISLSCPSSEIDSTVKPFITHGSVNFRLQHFNLHLLDLIFYFNFTFAVVSVNRNRSMKRKKETFSDIKVVYVMILRCFNYL